MRLISYLNRKSDEVLAALGFRECPLYDKCDSRSDGLSCTSTRGRTIDGERAPCYGIQKQRISEGMAREKDQKPNLLDRAWKGTFGDDLDK